MSKHHVKAVFEQFQWLNKHFEALKPSLSEATVERADINTLDWRAGSISGYNLEMQDTVKIFLFDCYGTLISTVHEANWLRWAMRYFFVSTAGKNIREALTELGERANTCSYIVLIVNNGKIVVSREPKGRTFADLLVEKAEKEARDAEQAREEVKKEMAS